MFLSVVILGGFTTETHAMAHSISADTPNCYLHHVKGRIRREARLSSSLSSKLSSAHVAKQRHNHRFLIPGDPALTIGCVKCGEAIK